MKQLFVIFSMVFAITLTTSCEKENESGEGSEGLGGEQGESGQMWNRVDTANETVNGINLILVFDDSTQSFKGTLLNTNTNVAQQVRVETHVYDAAGVSIEFGPTTPADMQPGESRSVTLAANNAGSFIQFSMHPEVGSTSGEGSNEAPEGSGN